MNKDGQTGNFLEVLAELLNQDSVSDVHLQADQAIWVRSAQGMQQVENSFVSALELNQWLQSRQSWSRGSFGFDQCIGDLPSAFYSYPGLLGQLAAFRRNAAFFGRRSSIARLDAKQVLVNPCLRKCFL